MQEEEGAGLGSSLLPFLPSLTDPFSSRPPERWLLAPPRPSSPTHSTVGTPTQPPLAAAPPHGQPGCWVLWCPHHPAASLCPLLTPRRLALPAVITLRCMVQFIGRETKYRYGARGQPWGAMSLRGVTSLLFPPGPVGH